MSAPDSIVTRPTTLEPLDSIPALQRGLIAVTFFGFLSLITTISLFLPLCWRLLPWSHKSGISSNSRIDQFIILLTNLIFADIHQSCAFWLNAHWLVTNSITVSTNTCWAQGWFLSTGDLGSGLFTLIIALHAFADIVFNYRLGPRTFYSVVISIWVFNYSLPVIGIARAPTDFYARAGAWCWINTKYIDERLYLHYVWVIICEFGTIIIYSLIFIVLQKRLRNSFYANSDTAIRARGAAKVIVAYPIIYVVCTLPLVKARLTSMAGKHVSFVELTIAGAIYTSNGWLDVLLYTLTRSASIFHPIAPSSSNASAASSLGVLDTFRHRPDQAYGTTTVIEAGGRRLSLPARGGTGRGLPRKGHQGGGHSRNGSTEELWPPAFSPGSGLARVKADTTVVVQSDTVLELEAMRREKEGEEGRRGYGR